MRNENQLMKQIMLRVPQDLRDEIERAAAAEKRSMANLTRIILEQWLAARAGSRRGSAPAGAEAAAQ
jgi:uncharacterized protein (DUF1778 family)